MLETEQTVQPISEIRSSHQSHVYEVCEWYGLWDTHIYVAVVAVSVGVCVQIVYFTSLPVCLHT